MKSRILIGSSLSLCLLNLPAFANPTLSQILVTSDQQNTNNQLENPLQTLNPSQEAGAVLRKNSGVEAQRLGGHGLDLLIRGQGQSAINVLIDGGKIEGACPNRMDPPTAYTNLNSFDKLTLIKGMKSLQYGAGGTAGTVLLERINPEFAQDKNLAGKLSTATASNGLQHDLNAEIAAGTDKFFVVLQGSDTKADNYKAGDGSKIKTAYHTKQAHIDLGFRPAENQLIKFSHEISNTKDALYQGAVMDAPKSDGSMNRLSYQASQQPGLVEAIDINFYHSKVDHLMDNYSLREPGMMQKMDTPSKTISQGGKIKLTSWAGKTQIDYGVLLQKIEKQATMFNRTPGTQQQNKSQWLMWPDAQTEQTSWFVEANSEIGAKNNLIYGLRLDKVRAQAKTATKAPDNNLGRKPIEIYANSNANFSGKTRQTETNLNALLRYEHQLSESLRGFAGISRSFRTADETERFIARNTWSGNPDLKPEEHRQIDLGIEQAGENLNWQANLFFDQVNNYILRDKAKNQAALNQAALTNTGEGYVNIDAKIYGAEFDWQYSPNQIWLEHNLRPLIGGNLAITQGKNTSNNRDLSNMSPLNGLLFIGVEPRNQAWLLRAETQFATKQTKVDTAYEEEAAAAWQVVNLYGEYQLNRSFSLNAGVDNLFNQTYFTHQNRTDAISGENYKLLEPGRNFWLKLSARF